MNILYLGDIVGLPGIAVIETALAELVKDYSVDLVFAQAENVTDGKGISLTDYDHLKEIGIDFFAGGNWTLRNKTSYDLLNDEHEPIIRPANLPEGTVGLGHKYLSHNGKKILGISLQGAVVGRDANNPMDNPLKVVDQILAQADDTDAIIVNFHGDFSSEKVIIGHYLDGRVSAVIGDHWHVPTADARLLPKGTAHITDVGMCGILNSSLGVSLDSVVPRWRDGLQTRNIPEYEGPKQLNAVLITTDSPRKSTSIKQVQKIL